MKKRITILTLALCVLILLTACSPSAMPLDSTIWDSWDAGTYDERRYGMALWLFETDWFEGKTKDDVLKDLPSHFQDEIIEDSTTFSLKYSDEFMERWDPDYIPNPVAELDIFFDSNNKIIKAVLRERGSSSENYEAVKEWNVE